MDAHELKKYTSDEFFALGKFDDTLRELINGDVVALASPNIAHQRLTRNILFEIESYIRRNSGKCEVFSAPTDVKLDNINVVVPDIFIACKPENFDKQKYNGAPEFIIEIVSTNRIDDYVRKLSLYQTHGVREYWIIDPEEERTLRYCFINEKKADMTAYKFDEAVPVGIYSSNASPLIINISELLKGQT